MPIRLHLCSLIQRSFTAAIGVRIGLAAAAGLLRNVQPGTGSTAVTVFQSKANLSLRLDCRGQLQAPTLLARCAL